MGGMRGRGDREKGEDKPEIVEVFAKNCMLQLFPSYIVYLCVPDNK